MSTPALDDRTFENAVELTPEEAASNRKHFEDKGYVIEDVPEADAAPPAAITPPAEPIVETPPPAQPTPVESAPSDEDLMDQALGINPTTHDGDKKGRQTRRTQKIKEQAEEIERLKRALAEPSRTAQQPPVQGMPTGAPPASAAAPVATPPPPPTVEAPKPREFDKPRPLAPKYEDFLSEDDPTAAFAAASNKHTDEITDWKFEKRDHDQSERQRVDQETRNISTQQTQQADRVTAINSRIQAAKTKFADYDAVVNAGNQPGGATYSPMLRYLMTEHLPDGFDLAYQLGKPENRALLQSINERTQFRESDPASLRAAEITALTELGAFRVRATNAPAQPPAVAVPPPAVSHPVQTPPTPPPARVEAAPTPVRGRGAPAPNPSEMDEMDSDARRALRRQLGQMVAR